MIKIFIITERRADYSRFKPILDLIVLEKELDYSLTVTGAHIKKEMGHTIDEIINDGFKIDFKIVEERIIYRGSQEKRSDDNISVIQTRFKKYIDETQPLADIYKNTFEGRYFEIDASQEISIIQRDIQNRLKNAQF